MSEEDKAKYEDSGNEFRKGLDELKKPGDVKAEDVSTGSFVG